MRNYKIKSGFGEITKRERNKGNDLKYEIIKYIYDFQPFETIRSFGEDIICGKIAISKTEEGQNNLLDNIVEFNNRTKNGKKGIEKRKKIQ